MRNIRKKNLKNMGRSALSFILIISLVCSQIPQSAYAADQTEEIPAYYGMMSLAGSIQLYCNTADINKNIYSGGDFTCSGTDIRVDGNIETVGQVYQWAGSFQAGDTKTQCSPAALPDIRPGIESKSEEWDERTGYVNINGQELDNAYIKTTSGVQVSGTDYSGDCYIMAEESIQYSVSTLNTKGGRLVLYSENGDIGISGDSIVINGILAAPNGTVRINADTVTINGRIYAGAIEMSGTSFQLHASDEDMELISEGANLVKVYDTRKDFLEGTVDGLFAGAALSLNICSKKTQTWNKQYNSETDNGVTADMEFNVDRITTDADSPQCSITLKGKSKSLPDLGGGAYFKRYGGHLYAFVNQSMLWKDAEQFCEACGGHLATISSMEENNILREMAAKKSEYTAIGFTDEEEEGRWKWVTEEEASFVNWNPGEPNNSFGSGQNHAYMYSSGRWDDGYDYIQAPFFCEWEDESVLEPVGRNLKLVVEVVGSVIPGEGWEATENDGITTLVYCMEKIAPFETVELKMSILSDSGEGYIPLVQDCYYVYYDSSGKGHRISMDDVWMPVEKYLESGSWTAVYDSEKNGTKWNRIFWDATQAGDSDITVFAKAYDVQGENIEETELVNNRQLDGLKGRYIEVRVQMQRGQDYRSPKLDRLVIVAGNAQTDLTPGQSVPKGTLWCRSMIQAGDCRTAYYKLAGGAEHQDAEVKWSLWDEKEEQKSQDYSLEKETPYLIHYAVSRPGIYYLQAETEYEGQAIVARQRIVVVEAEALKDMEPVAGENDIRMVLELADYGRPGETLQGNIYFPEGGQIQEIQVLQDGHEAEAGTDGKFTAVLPEQEGECIFDIDITLTDGRKTQKQVVVIVDGSQPVIRIVPDSEKYCAGDKAVFRIETEDASPMKNIAVRYDGKELYYEWYQPLEIANVTEGKHILEVVGEDVAGNVTEASYEFVADEAAGGQTAPDKQPVQPKEPEVSKQRENLAEEELAALKAAKQSAVEWLKAQVDETGLWKGNGLMNTTCNALAVLRAAGEEMESAAFMAWLDEGADANIDAQCHAVWGNPDTEQMKSIWSQQNTDGGFGYNQQDASRIVLTAEYAVILNKLGMELTGDNTLQTFCSGKYTGDFSGNMFLEQAALARALQPEAFLSWTKETIQKILSIQQENGSIYNNVEDTMIFIILSDEIIKGEE